jgi:7-carboxy-7-deazaguanine synthase
MIRVNTVYPSIQGEGAMTGRPMVLIRLQGCSVGCPWCDTKETWPILGNGSRHGDDLTLYSTLADAIRNPRGYSILSEDNIAAFARDVAPNIDTALVTGGEPAEQDLGVLTECLRGRGFRTSLETSGTALGHLGGSWDWITVSPKIGMPGGRPILDDAIAVADEIKFVVCNEADLSRNIAWLSDRRMKMKPTLIVSLQPVSQSRAATEICVGECLRSGWNLSLQVHKYAGLP